MKRRTKRNKWENNHESSAVKVEGRGELEKTSLLHMLNAMYTILEAHHLDMSCERGKLDNLERHGSYRGLQKSGIPSKSSSCLSRAGYFRHMRYAPTSYVV
jgi:hypothetical protein